MDKASPKAQEPVASLDATIAGKGGPIQDPFASRSRKAHGKSTKRPPDANGASGSDGAPPTPKKPKTGLVSTEAVTKKVAVTEDGSCTVLIGADLTAK